MRRRRDFIVGLSGLVAWPAVARAQQAERIGRVGVLYPFPWGNVFTQSMAALREGLAQFGWIEGRNLRIDAHRGPQEQIDDRAEELIRSAPDVIVVLSGRATRAVQQRTSTIPIVFVAVGDAVVGGLVKSLARPEGNVTGFTNLFVSFGGKWVELLKAVVPQISRTGIVADPSFTGFGPRGYFPSIEAAAKAMAIEPVRIPVRTPAEVANAIRAFAEQPNGGLLVMPGAPVPILIYKLAVEYKLPSIGSGREDAANGALLSYGSNRISMFRDAATYVDRILRGAKVGDLPVQFPTKFELIVNLKTAKTIGLDVPHELLALADEVIE
jgi:putative tryptophan/tyrosine transport system substrate-binding protein